MEAEKLGVRIRKYREQKEMSIADLADRAGLEVDFIQGLEQDDIYPSLGPLLRIARALGTRLGTFLDDHVSSDPLVMRVADRKEELSMLKGKDKAAALKFHSLGRGKSDRHMEPFFIEILPESAEEVKLSSHEGEEFIVVLSGEIEVTYGNESHVLKAGDSIYYNSVVPHYVGCKGSDKAQIYAIMYFPD